jgi:DNA (cytosine-5)-methyltransferase 1
VRQDLLRRKLGRISQGKPRVIDLFAGCGGISLGFHKAGFEIAAAVEFDPEAAKSHGLNFHHGDPVHSQSRDITQLQPQDLAFELGLGKIEEAFDVIVGGPPCQAFARVGRSKLREVAEHPEAFLHDNRASLYIHYLQFVDACQPLAILIENVPDILNHGGHNLAEEIAEALREKGYECRYTLLNSAYYGVPQMRERMFLVALRKELTANGMVQFPRPTHWVDLPSGYEGSRSVALRMLEKSRASDTPHSYIDPPQSLPSLPPAVTVQDALRDLPPIYARELLHSGKLRRGTRRFDNLIPYTRTKNLTDYAKLMRNWPGFESEDGVWDHVIRYLPRDYELFARMKHGDQYPEALRMAELMFEEKLADEVRLKGRALRKGSKDWQALRDSIVPPYDAGKFPNKWRKMEADKPSRTLMAHLGKDSYSHIHYDCQQARTISVREAARLQSFPDGFVFAGTMNPAFRQIGNAVPPLMAQAIAIEIFKVLSREAKLRQPRAIRATQDTAAV